MSDVVFVDSNILICAHDADAGPNAPEDLNAGQTIAGVQIFNPLVA